MLSSLCFCRVRFFHRYTLVLILIVFMIESKDSFAQEDPLSALLAQAQNSVKAITEPNLNASAVSMIWLSKSFKEKGEAARIIDRSIKAATSEAQQYLKTLNVTHIKPALLLKRLNVNHVKIDQSFPLNLEVFIDRAKAPITQALIRQAQAATMISYRGDTLKNHEQLKLTCEAALNTVSAEDQEGVWIILESLSILSTDDLRIRCNFDAKDDPTTMWARPDLEGVDEGKLLLVSRGLSQLGRAEIELGPLDTVEAKALWNDFIEHLTTSSTVENALSRSSQTCVRATHRFEGKCIRLLPRKNAESLPLQVGE